MSFERCMEKPRLRTHLRTINVHDLMHGEKRVMLQHGDKSYLLSITRKGKLILTASEEERLEQLPKTK